ncbi:hypothetical protein CHS0354_041397 [Potamilus streckersoni]|uniref:Uncharacterized protein n=1 Tax=Potamilus streckersoni TaxID=2493646 RepID=A0AAE0W9J8_9BIVA|nr:hypothetical protein CHS0354_041397 [Potamilus streckersoni]
MEKYFSTQMIETEEGTQPTGLPTINTQSLNNSGTDGSMENSMEKSHQGETVAYNEEDQAGN